MHDCSGKVFLKNGKNSKCIISELLKDISHCRRHAWDKENKILADKFDKLISDMEVKFVAYELFFRIYLYTLF